MKKTLLLALATALTAAPALALDVNGEAFVTFKDSTSNADVKTAGTDLERFRVFISHKFDDKWAFKGRFSMAQSSTSTTLPVTIPEAMFVGSGILMDGDSMKFGVQELPVTTAEGQFGWRWITKTFGDLEGFTNNGTTTPGGFSYGMKFGQVGLTLFTLEGEVAETTGSNDNNKTNGVYVDFKVNDQVKVWAQNSVNNDLMAYNTTTGAISASASGTIKATTVLSAGVSYSIDMVDAMLNYHKASYTMIDGATEVKANTAMGLAANFKKLGGSKYNLYAAYTAGYDSYSDTKEDTASKMMIGPNFALAEKLNMGVFYGTEAYNSDYKNANTGIKDPSEITVKLAAKF